MLQARVERPIGIENLAFAFGKTDALAQASFVAELCERTGAFILLDVHNIHCQAENFGLDPLELAARYGLERVREIHIAGGVTSTTRSGARPFRRDSTTKPSPMPRSRCYPTSRRAAPISRS